MKRLKVIGLTGGIGSGKSTVCGLLAEHHAAIIDTDQIAREVVQPHSEGLRQVIAEFGQDYLTEQGELDRAKLRATIFADPTQKQRLEAILHPLIRQTMLAEIETCQQRWQQGEPIAAIVVAIPLLVETLQGEKPDYLDEIWVVDCDEATQLTRASQRDGQTAAQIQAIIQQQASRQQRLHWADRIIDNNGDQQALQQQLSEHLPEWFMFDNAA
ncbi:dephospho-CoA kinase [Thiomicrorhabdus cannonii]|uniref:dephospho-CoA kinase n=1 Tax=Thiomicrorhabdus cannonii TaxID=2748011 RepID=UPI0015B93F64|nr:dephospho-CoA kinase [Thiomicrorhabdus cannonii]